jgi:hypothetical protein
VIDDSIALFFKGAFQLYDIDKDGTITYDEMLQIVQSIYKMTGESAKLPADEDTPEKVSPPLLSTDLVLINTTSVLTRSLGIWITTKTPSSLMRSLWREASRIQPLCRQVAMRGYVFHLTFHCLGIVII